MDAKMGLDSTTNGGIFNHERTRMDTKKVTRSTATGRLRNHEWTQKMGLDSTANGREWTRKENKLLSIGCLSATPGRSCLDDQKPRIEAQQMQWQKKG
jgi:hypothetical protein